MKKFLAALIAISFIGVVSCGGSSGGSGGGGEEKGDYVLEAKQIAFSGLFASIYATMMANQAALGDFGSNHGASPVGTGTGTFDTDYDALHGQGTADLSGTYSYVGSGSYATGADLALTNIIHTTSVTAGEVKSFSFDGTTYSSLGYGSAGGDEMIGDSDSDSEFTVPAGEPVFTALTLSENGISANAMTVTLEDATTGTATFEDWTYTGSLSGDTFTVTASGLSATVVYSGETYTCTQIGASYATDFDSSDTLTVNPNIHCTCPLCDS